MSQGDALAAYREYTVYGDIFPCSICAGVFFDNEVVQATSVKQLCTGAGLGRYVHPIAMDDARFLAFGKRWCCKLCQRYVASDRLPPLSMNNSLGTPWLKTPPVLHNLSSLERDVVTGYQPFDKVLQLRKGLVGRLPPSKTVHILSSQPERRQASQCIASHAVPPGYKMQLRVEECKSAFRYLLDVSKTHKTLLEDGVTPQFEPRTYEIKAVEFEKNLTDATVGQETSPVTPPSPPASDDPTIDWFCKSGPSLSTINTIVVPDLDATLPPDWATLVEKGPNEIYGGMGQLLDPEKCAPPEMPTRNPHVPFTDWCTSRIGNVDRSGPANDPDLLLGFSAVSTYSDPPQFLILFFSVPHRKEDATSYSQRSDRNIWTSVQLVP